MKVIVTGAKGFIGSRIANDLRSAGHEVIRLVRRPEADADEDTLAVDIGSAESVRELRRIERVDAVIHCAGIAHRTTNIDNAEYQRVNVEGTANIAGLAAAMGIRQFIYLSSVMVYGRTNGALINESSPCDPVDEYARSKLQAERSASEICAVHGIGLTILRPAPVIGEGCKGNFIRLVSAIDRRRFLFIGSGDNRKSMIYVGDVSSACAAVLTQKSNVEPEVFNLSADPITVHELCDSIYQALQRSPSRVSLPAPFVKRSIQLVSRVIKHHSVASIKRSIDTWLAEDIYSPSAIFARYGIRAEVSIKEAARRTVHNYKKQRAHESVS